MAWCLAGFIVSLVVAAIAWHRSRVGGGYYDAHVYAMTARTHRSYALASLAFAAAFAFTLATRREAAGLAALALYAVIAIFYAASFLRGAADPDE
ncbi:MAG: hypothetical protein WB615_12400 [Candidatus Tumulicola sp.]